MEHAKGTRITLEVVEGNCKDCFFKGENCALAGIKCVYYERTDHKNIIYKEIK